MTSSRPLHLQSDGRMTGSGGWGVAPLPAVVPRPHLQLLLSRHSLAPQNGFPVSPGRPESGLCPAASGRPDRRLRQPPAAAPAGRRVAMGPAARLEGAPSCRRGRTQACGELPLQGREKHGLPAAPRYKGTPKNVVELVRVSPEEDDWDLNSGLKGKRGQHRR